MSAVRKVEKWGQVINEAVSSIWNKATIEDCSDSGIRRLMERAKYHRKRVEYYGERKDDALVSLTRFGGSGIQVSEEVRSSFRPQVEKISASLYKVNNFREVSRDIARRLGRGEEYFQGVAVR